MADAAWLNASLVAGMGRPASLWRLLSWGVITHGGDQYFTCTTRGLKVSGSYVGPLTLTPLFKPACRNKRIKKRGESYSICSGKYCEGYKQKTRKMTERGEIKEESAEVSKVVWKRKDVPQIFLSVLKGLVSFHQSF